MFNGFSQHDIPVAEGIKIHAKVGGSGPCVLLLHGFPQTHVCWHKIAPRLAEAFTVVATDLRGYGASSKPKGGHRHKNYSKRAMADDQVEVMRRLGFETFRVLGHDRGGRVAHRMALDHKDVVERLVLVDIAPTATMYRATDRAFAESYYHWFFLIQPHDFPERLIGADPEYFLRHTLQSWCKLDNAITPVAFDAYLASFKEREAIHAACEDYRAAATIDLKHDAADDASGNKIAAPLKVIWGARGTVGRQFNVIATWQEKTVSSIEGVALECGHFVPEEDPDGLLDALLPFIAG